MAKTVNAESRQWLLLEKIGSGDAGEVWRVESDGKKAVLKRPVQNVSGGTIMRQASQIETEGQILSVLDGIRVVRNGLHIHTPFLIDKSIQGTSGTTGLFIVSEEVSGVSITRLLDQLRVQKTTFSQVLTLKVLASGFQLLREVHKKGILWNDVKMDHIFWDEASNKMSFIDWGNGLRFDPENPDEHINPGLDFQQLIDEGHQLLRQISPDLIQDLAWPVSATGLTDLDIFHLQMRVEYLENHLSMRVIEYKLLFNRYLESAGNANNLQDVFEVKKALERLGVQTNNQDILTHAKKLWLFFLGNNQTNSIIDIISLIEKNIPLPPHWQLSIYFQKSLSKTSTESLVLLIEACLSENWPEAIWQFHKEHIAGFSITDANAIINTMRNLSDIAKDTPELISNRLANIQKDLKQNINRILKQNELNTETIDYLKQLNQKLIDLQENWSSLSATETIGEKYLNSRELLATLANLGLNIPPNDQRFLTTLLSKTREVYRAWLNAELDLAQKLIRELFCLDPHAYYLHALENDIEKTLDWVETLKEGPQATETVNNFGAQLIKSLPKACIRLGTPDWLTTMATISQAIKDCQDLDLLRSYLTQANLPLTWADFTGLTLEFQKPAQPITKFSKEQEQAINSFYAALANKNDAKNELLALKKQVPNYHFLYLKLIENFEYAWALHPPKQLEVEINAFPPADRSRVEEAFSVLSFIKSWKENSQSRAIRFPHQAPKTSKQWIQIEEIQHTDKQWKERILPTLSKLKQKDWDVSMSGEPHQSPYPDLSKCVNDLFKLAQTWKNVENIGLFKENVFDMIAHASSAQTHFYRFWQSLEKSPVAAQRWLCMVHQPILSEINQNLLLAIRHLQSVARALDVLNTPQMARTRLAINSAGELMFTLVQLNDLILPPSRDFNLYRHWRKQYLDLIQEGNIASIREHIQSIESIHPLLSWFDELLKRDTDYFKVSDSQRW